MRVALVSPLFESVPPRFYGGTERVVYNLCRGLTELDVEVTVFASGDSEVEGRLIPVVDEALRLRRIPPFDAAAYDYKLLSMVAERAHEFDIIHNHHDYRMLPLTRMTNTPLLTTLHGRLDLPDLEAAYNAFPGAHYVSISDNQRQPMPRLHWLRTIHHGIDAKTFEFHPKPGSYLAFLGRMSPEKRPDWAIEIAKRAGVPLKLAAKIEGVPDTEFYQTRVKPHIDGKFIEYVGEISEAEKSDFLGQALGLVFPIDWPEPFGLVMIEALACGTPVLARPCGAAPEVLSDGTTGYCNKSIQALADRVKDLASISRQGCRTWVEERFSLKRMTEDYLNVYRQLSQFSRARHAREGRTAGHRRHFLSPVQRTAD